VFVGLLPTAGTMPTMPVVLGRAEDIGADCGRVSFASLGILHPLDLHHILDRS
jgi:hypothetical protein